MGLQQQHRGGAGLAPYLIFYMAGSLAASLAQVWSDPGGATPSVGASGAIAAILGAYIAVFPASRVRLLIFTGFSMGVTRVLPTDPGSGYPILGPERTTYASFGFVQTS